MEKGKGNNCTVSGWWLPLGGQAWDHMEGFNWICRFYFISWSVDSPVFALLICFIMCSYATNYFVSNILLTFERKFYTLFKLIDYPKSLNLDARFPTCLVVGVSSVWHRVYTIPCLSRWQKWKNILVSPFFSPVLGA